MRKVLLASVAAGLAAAGMLAGSPASASVFVDDTIQGLTKLADLTAGVTYNVTATGVANIYARGGLDFDADGVATHTIADPYGAFNTAGCCYNDPTGNHNAGPAGQHALLGSLAGSFTAAPVDGSTDYFQLGSHYTFTAVASGALYGLVNDATGAYGDNGAGGFTVTVTAQGGAAPGVPEPASWALLILGFGGTGAMLRRRAVNPKAA